MQCELKLKHGRRIGNEKKLLCVAAFIVFLRQLRFLILHFTLLVADFKRKEIFLKEKKRIKTHNNPNSGAQTEWQI